MMTCKSLYILCLEFCIPKFENYYRGKEDGSCKWIEDLAAPVVEDMLNHAFYLANNQNKSINKIWREEWKIFFTARITSAILSWDVSLITYIGSRCKKIWAKFLETTLEPCIRKSRRCVDKYCQIVNIEKERESLTKCKVVVVKHFDPELVLALPKSVTILDFDGELINRGKITKPLLFQEQTSESWLPHAESILKALQLLRATLPNHASSSNTFSLTELHLGNIHVSSSDLKLLIKSCPNLSLLCHYQMVAALYELHSEDWRKKKVLPKYKLKNLDVDFSHVIRCRMSPEWVLSPDALHLGVALCPSASCIRVRFDCSTPHDVLTPLLNLSKIKQFSAVCVSSGERTLLDFGDMAPIFEKFGPISLHFIELKVIEEVEIHVIIEYCTKVETLILSGCGYVTPPTCSSFNCQRYEKGSFKKLKSLFYADGDDFSWDHGVPECFWKASLCPSGKTRPSRVQGLLLEFPRMSTMLIKEIFHTGNNKTPLKLPFPDLLAVSFCRFEEISANDIAAICGILPTGERISCQNLKYIRLSDCEKIDETEEKRLRKWLKHSKLIDLKIEVDSSWSSSRLSMAFIY